MKQLKDVIHYYWNTDLKIRAFPKFSEPMDVNLTPAYLGCLDGVFPLLRPLSDLTKEIEHNGEKFVPITELRCIEQGNWDDGEFIQDHTQIIDYGIRKKEYEPACYWIEWKDGLSQTQVFSFKGGDFNRIWKDEMASSFVNNQLMLFEKLFEWHFDVFGLIESNQAIKK